MKTQITRCYLVQILDDDGNEIKCEYVFTDNKSKAQTAAKRLKQEIIEQEKQA